MTERAVFTPGQRYWSKNNHHRESEEVVIVETLQDDIMCWYLQLKFGAENEHNLQHGQKNST